MSTSEEEQNIIYIEHEYDNEYRFNKNNQSPIDLQDQPELPVSCKKLDRTYNAVQISKRFVVIKINNKNTLVKIEHPHRSKPLHVHIIEYLHSLRDNDGNYFDDVCGIVAFVIFTDHILRIRLTNTYDSSSFEECKTDFSFRISETESSFKIIEDDRDERLRVCLVSDEGCWKKVELFEICLLNNDDECLFTRWKKIFFRLPPNITGIEIDWENDYVVLTMTGKSTEFQIYIFDGKSGLLDDDTDSIFLLNKCERCILATSDQLDRFQDIGFQIVATIYVSPFKDDDDFPEIQEFIKVMLEELNKYVRNHEEDSDCGSDSD